MTTFRQLGLLLAMAAITCSAAWADGPQKVNRGDGGPAEPAGKPAEPQENPRRKAWLALTDVQRQQQLKRARTSLEELFGKRLKGVRSTANPSDDLALAKEMLKARGQVQDDVAFGIVLCETACELAERHRTGSATVLEAISHLREYSSQDRAAWLEKIADVRQKAYFASPSTKRKETGEALISAKLALARAQVREEDFNAAMATCRSAVSVARAIRSDKLPALEAAMADYQQLQKLGVTIAGLKSRLMRNPKDQLARNELIRLYVVEQDDPGKAATLINEGAPEDYRENVPDAAEDTATLDEPAALRLGQWYQTLTDRATSRGKIAVLTRAESYLTRYMELHDTNDVARLRAKMSLEKIQATLKELTTPAEPKQNVPFRRVLAFTPSVHLACPGNRYFGAAFAHRTIEAWVLAGEEDGLIWDQGNKRTGTALAVFKDRVYFAIGDGRTHHKWVTDQKTKKRRQVAIPAAVLSGKIPDRKNWFHVVGQFTNGQMSLWIDGELAADRRLGKKVIPGNGDRAAIGGGEGNNAGYWRAKNFGGKIAAIRVANKTRYARQFDPEPIVSASGAFSFLCGDRFVSGKIDKFGTNDSASSTVIKWYPVGGEVDIQPVNK